VSAWETLVTLCESILTPTTVATLSGTDFNATTFSEGPRPCLQIPEVRCGDLRAFSPTGVDEVRGAARGASMLQVEDAHPDRRQAARGTPHLRLMVLGDLRDRVDPPGEKPICADGLAPRSGRPLVRGETSVAAPCRASYNLSLIHI